MLKDLLICIAVVVGTMLLAVFGCIWMAGSCSREEEKKNGKSE